MAKLRDKSYRLADDRSGESFLLKTGKKGNMTIYDAQVNARRVIKHCPNQKTNLPIRAQIQPERIR